MGLGADDAIAFDGSAESNGRFLFLGGEEVTSSSAAPARTSFSATPAASGIGRRRRRRPLRPCVGIVEAGLRRPVRLRARRGPHRSAGDRHRFRPAIETGSCRRRASTRISVPRSAASAPAAPFLQARQRRSRWCDLPGRRRQWRGGLPGGRGSSSPPGAAGQRSSRPFRPHRLLRLILLDRRGVTPRVQGACGRRRGSRCARRSRSCRPCPGRPRLPSRPEAASLRGDIRCGGRPEPSSHCAAETVKLPVTGSSSTVP